MNIFTQDIETDTSTIQLTFNEITSFEQSQKPLEDFNQLAWFPIDEAIEKLKRGSHKWGVEMWKMEHQAK